MGEVGVAYFHIYICLSGALSIESNDVPESQLFVVCGDLLEDASGNDMSTENISSAPEHQLERAPTENDHSYQRPKKKDDPGKKKPPNRVVMLI